LSVSVLELPSRIDRSSWVSWACYYASFMISATRVGVDDMLGDQLGLALLIGSVLAFFSAVMLLQRYMRISLTSNTFGDPQHLVTSGVFRWTRNPIYLAFVVPLGALGYFSPIAAAIGVAVYLFAMTFWVISREEIVLAAAFPKQFNDYCARTPRWLLI